MNNNIINIDIKNNIFLFPEEIQKGAIYNELLELSIENNDHYIEIENKYMNFNYNIEKYFDINDIIKIIDSYNYWLVDNLPFKFYDFILENIELIKENLLIIEDICKYSYYKEIEALIYFEKLTKIYYCMSDLSKQVQQKNDEYEFDNDNNIIYLYDWYDNENNIKYYFNEKLCGNMSLDYNTIHYKNDNEYIYYSHYLLKNNLLNLILYFDEKGYKIPNTICLMCARADNIKYLNYFYEKGYSLYDIRFNDCLKYIDIYFSNIKSNIHNNLNNKLNYDRYIKKTYNSPNIKIFNNCLYFLIINGYNIKSIECVKFCIKNKCIIDFDMLVIACIYNNIEVLKLLYKETNKKYENKKKIDYDIFIDKAYNYSIWNKSLECLYFLINNHRNLNFCNLLTMIYSNLYSIKEIIIFHQNNFTYNEFVYISYFIIKNKYDLEVLEYFYNIGYEFNTIICCISIIQNDYEFFCFILNKLKKSQLTSIIIEYIIKNIFDCIPLLNKAITSGCPINEDTYNFIINTKICGNNKKNIVKVIEIINKYYDISKFNKIKKDRFEYITRDTINLYKLETFYEYFQYSLYNDEYINLNLFNYDEEIINNIDNTINIQYPNII